MKDGADPLSLLLFLFLLSLLLLLLERLSIRWLMAFNDESWLETVSCNFTIDVIKNCRLNFSALTLGNRFGLAATKFTDNSPAFSLSTTVQMSTASVTTRRRAPDLPSTRFRENSLMESLRDAFSHSETRVFLASRASRYE